MIFLDTNIMIYASGYHGEDDPRTEIARTIVAEPTAHAISVQVIHEFYDRVTRPGRGLQLKHDEAMEIVTQWRQFVVQPMTLDIFDAAIVIRERHGFRYYDSAIIAAAQALGCDMLYSEDMQHGQTIGALTIINPFRELTLPAS